MSSEENSDIEIESGESDNSSEDSCKKYTVTPEKPTLIKSMGDVTSNWTPLKYCLGSDFDLCNKKTKQRIVKKAMMATDNVLENIAPGQVEKLKLSVFNKTKKRRKRMSCYPVCARQYLKQQEEIQEYGYSVVCMKDSDGK